ncbi:MAG: response regulator [Gammaproteobacteria bacterium]
MLNKRRLLLIDNSDSARTILFREISRQLPNLDIIACATAKEALTSVRRFEFEIITTAISLPDMDGYKLIEEIRKSAKNRDTAIFVVSGDADTRIMGSNPDDTNAVTAYFNKSEGHKPLVNFIINFLGKDNQSPVKILYVDKSATSTAITSSILSKNEIDFIHFSESSEALDFLREDIASNDHCSVDILISDLMLTSKISGFEMIQTIRNELDLDYLGLPVLLMTIEPAEDEHTDFTGIFGAGANDFITKPVNEDDLLDRISTLVNIKRQNQALNV